MKQLFVLFFLILSVTFLASPMRATAFSQCHSERKGYCIKLDPTDLGQNASHHVSPRFFALAFPGLEFLEGYGISFDSDIGDILTGLYRFGVAIAGVSALVMFTYGGMRYLTAGDSPSGVGVAKKAMQNAIFGLALVVLSYLILYLINPDLTFTLHIPALTEQISPPKGTYSQSSYAGYSQSSYAGYSQSSYAAYAQSSYYAQSNYAPPTPTPTCIGFGCIL